MAAPNLTRDQAEQRAALLAVDSYLIELDLTDGSGQPGTGTFSSTTTVRFHSREAGASTWIDLMAAKVESAVLNGEKLDVSGFREEEGLHLPDLAEVNELTVRAQCRYTIDGTGMHRFVDPADNEVYLYTKFEPSDAKKVFACFDQPDLKATFQVTVTAPAQWTVVSNTSVASSTTAPNGIIRHTFESTPKLSTYLIAVVAGPYAGWRDEYTDGDRTIPLGLYCRASLAEHFDPENMFAETKQGFDYFHKTFRVSYPFTKYDQVIVPEFNAGAMENAGCVTFYEEYVFRGKVTNAMYKLRCQTIMHEMAHMWFGDLVTMRWWNDLWLNESFADLAAVFAQAEGTRYTNAWASYAGVRKSWAYMQDQLPSTHPIATDVPDLDSVKANFDGITYAKGASVLKQLIAYVGRENFFAGLQLYFTRHAWGNATLSDLLAALEETSGRDLASWSKQWLETTGVNLLRPEFAVDEAGRFTEFSVIQRGAEPGAGEFRAHRIAIGVYDDLNGQLVRTQRVEADITTKRTEIPELVGLPSGQLVLVNDDDLTYCNLRLDQKSLTTLKERIADFADPLPRILCWSAAWEMTRNAEFKARDFVSLVLNGIHAETEIPMMERLIIQVQAALNSYVDPEWAPEGWRQFTETFLALARAAKPGSDEQLIFVKTLCNAILDEDKLSLLKRLLDGSEQLDGLSIDVNLRWTLLNALVANGIAGEEEIDAELARDFTAKGQENAEKSRTLLPNLTAKDRSWNKVFRDEDVSNGISRSIAMGFWHPCHRELLAPFTARYFAEVDDMWQRHSFDQAELAAWFLFPTWAISQDTIAAADEWLSGDHPTSLRRSVIEGQARVVRALRAREFDRS